MLDFAAIRSSVSLPNVTPRQVLAAFCGVIVAAAAAFIAWFVLAFCGWLLALLISVLGTIAAGFIAGRYVYDRITGDAVPAPVVAAA